MKITHIFEAKKTPQGIDTGLSTSAAAITRALARKSTKNIIKQRLSRINDLLKHAMTKLGIEFHPIDPFNEDERFRFLTWNDNSQMPIHVHVKIKGLVTEIQIYVHKEKMSSAQLWLNNMSKLIRSMIKVVPRDILTYEHDEHKFEHETLIFNTIDLLPEEERKNILQQFEHERLKLKKIHYVVTRTGKILEGEGVEGKYEDLINKLTSPQSVRAITTIGKNLKVKWERIIGITFAQYQQYKSDNIQHNVWSFVIEGKDDKGRLFKVYRQQGTTSMGTQSYVIYEDYGSTVKVSDVASGVVSKNQLIAGSLFKAGGSKLLNQLRKDIKAATNEDNLIPVSVGIGKQYGVRIPENSIAIQISYPHNSWDNKAGAARFARQVKQVLKKYSITDAVTASGTTYGFIDIKDVKKFLQ